MPFSTSEQTHCAPVVCDSEWVTVAFTWCVLEHPPNVWFVQVTPCQFARCVFLPIHNSLWQRQMTVTSRSTMCECSFVPYDFRPFWRVQNVLISQCNSLKCTTEYSKSWGLLLKVIKKINVFEQLRDHLAICWGNSVVKQLSLALQSNAVFHIST